MVVDQSEGGGGPTAVSSTRDMVLSESFHRLKRTTILLATALAVLALAEPGGSGSTAFNLPWVNAQVSLLTAQLIIGTGMIYYAWGFGLEALVSRRLNSAALAASDEGKFVEMLRRREKELSQLFPEMETVRERLFVIVGDLQGRLENGRSVEHNIRDRITAVFTEAVLFERKMAIQLQSLPQGGLRPIPVEDDGAAQRIASYTRRLIKDYMQAGDRPMGEPPTYLSETIASIDSWAARADEVASALKQVQRDLRRLSVDLGRERMASFWGFEVGGVAVAVVAALALTACSYLAVPGTQPNPPGTMAAEPAAGTDQPGAEIDADAAPRGP